MTPKPPLEKVIQNRVSFTVLGKPEPQGSSRGFVRGGRVVITSANKKLKPWRQEVSGCAMVAIAGKQFVKRPTPVSVEALFLFERPKSVKVGMDKVSKPDLDKLLRALLDSLTGIVFEDDSQVTGCTINKGYGNPARVEVEVTWIEQAGLQGGVK
jgi:Holliday junction resolvase RusA-like endonuclease